MKAELSRPCVNSRTRRAAFCASSSVASSRGIDNLGVFQNRAAPDRVVAALHRPPADQVNGPAQQLSQLVLHLYVIQQAPVGLRQISRQDVNIALRPEVGTQCRAEQCQLLDLPAAAKINQAFSRYQL